MARDYIDPVNVTDMPHNHLIPMHKLSSAQISHILFLLDSGESATSIHHKTGYGATNISRICSQHCPNLAKPLGGCPCLLSSANISFVKHILRTRKVENATEAAGQLRNYSHKTFHTQTLH